MGPSTRSLRSRFLPPCLLRPVNEIDQWLALMSVLGSDLGAEATRLAGQDGCVLLPLIDLPPINLYAARQTLDPRVVAVRLDLLGRWCLCLSIECVEGLALEYSPVRNLNSEDDGGLWVGHPVE